MTPLEFAIAQLSEKAGRLTQTAGATLKFGLKHQPHPRDKTNLERLQWNISELIAAVEVLNPILELNGLEPISLWKDSEIDGAIDGILTHAEISEREGILSEPLTDFRLKPEKDES